MHSLAIYFPTYALRLQSTLVWETWKNNNSSLPTLLKYFPDVELGSPEKFSITCSLFQLPSSLLYLVALGVVRKAANAESHCHPELAIAPVQELGRNRQPPKFLSDSEMGTKSKHCLCWLQKFSLITSAGSSLRLPTLSLAI